MRKALLAVAALLVAAAGATAWAISRPDPRTESLLDGCARSRQAEFAREASSWVYVGDRNAPADRPSPEPQWLEGRVNEAGASQAEAAHPSGGDDPTTHDAFDFNLNVLPDPPYGGLLGGDPDRDEGNFEGEGEERGRIHIERELTAFPTWAWADAGDRVAVRGSWVWDCGHWDPGGERTEIHPYRAVWLVRNPGGVSPRSPYGEAEGDLYVSTEPTPAGVMAECAHRTKGDRVAYRACLPTLPRWLDVSGDYALELPAPPRPRGATRLVARVVDRGSTVQVVRPVVAGRRAVLRFHLDATPGERLVLAEQVFLGWRPVRPAALPVHVRVRFERLETRRAMDPGCPQASPGCGSPQSTLAGQIATPPGEWRIWSDVGGVWTLWPRVLRARDGASFALSETTDVYVARGRSWRVLLWTHECDFGVATFDDPAAAMAPCPRGREFGNFTGDDLPGLVLDRYRGAPRPGVRRRDAALTDPSTCPRSNRRGCFRVTYRVSVVHDERARARR